MVNNSYRYEISGIYINGDETTDILSESIISLATIYDYDNNNMPILYLEFNVKSDLYDEMVNNIETAKIILTVKKYDKKAASGLSHIFIRREFSYLMQTDPDYHKPLERLENSREPSPTSYKKGIIALIDTDLLDNNKVLYNDIIKKSNMISVVHRYTNHMNMIIEPFDNNDIIDCLIIPPIASIKELLKFLNEFSCFYEKGYRYFRDFGKTYLLSNNGNPVDDNSDIYNTMIIEILDTTESESKVTGIYTDTNQKVYIMQVDSMDTHMNIDVTNNKEYTSIIGITSSGDIKKLNLSIVPENSKEKVLLQRICNDNMRYLDNIKENIDSSSVVLQLSKSEIDSSIITPNKEYIIKNYREFSEYNGTFILSSKKDVFIQQNGEFISNTYLTFRKKID